jgi:hypothetical protein
LGQIQRWATILKNSEDYAVKKDHGQIQANVADTETRDCYRCGKAGHLAKDCRVKERIKCAKCRKEHLISKHDDWLKYAERNVYEEDEKDGKTKAKGKDKDKDKGKDKRL